MNANSGYIMIVLSSAGINKLEAEDNAGTLVPCRRETNTLPVLFCFFHEICVKENSTSLIC